jgi:hypothetical protein
MLRTAMIVVPLLAASSALAGPLRLHPLAMPGFTGEVKFAAPGVAATVDFAVFAPGTAGSPFPDEARYAYAYQIFSEGEPFSALALLGVDTPGTSAGHLSAFAQPLGKEPQQVLRGGTHSDVTGAFVFVFWPPVEPMGWSSMLYILSELEPVIEHPSLLSNNGAVATEFGLPTPVPAPGGMALGAAGLWLLARRRR